MHDAASVVWCAECTQGLVGAPFFDDCRCDFPLIWHPRSLCDLAPQSVLCFFVLCNRHRFTQFNRAPGPDQGDRTGGYLPFALSSYASYADLPLALLGAPVDIGALVKPGSRSLGKAKTETGRAALPGQDHMYPFGIIGVAPRYIPAGAVVELAGFRLSCTSTPTGIRETQAGGNRIRGECVCFFVLCNRHRFNRAPGPDQGDRTGGYLSTPRFWLRR